MKVYRAPSVGGIELIVWVLCVSGLAGVHIYALSTLLLSWTGLGGGAG